MISTVKVSWKVLENLEREYKKDSYFSELFKYPKEPFLRKGERLLMQGRLCIPEGEIRASILQDHHKSIVGAHRGARKTFQLINKNFFWPSMKKEIYKYVFECIKCQRAKSSNTTLGIPNPFPPPERKWEEISMDFLFDLPKTKDEKTGIFVVVDKLSKQAHFIPIESKFDALEVAKAFYKEVFRLHGIPRKIVSDRDPRFTGNFWKSLMKILEIKLNMSSAFHPQTDGQSERALRTIEEMLRCFVSQSQDNWSKYLPGLEFAYNNYKNETTKQSPFFLLYGHDPLTPSDILLSDESKEIDNPALSTYLTDMNTAINIAKESISLVNENVASKGKSSITFEVGSKVLLSTLNIKLKQKSKKLGPKYIGPFTVIENYASGNSYKLELPDEFSKLHPVFHISLLKPFQGDSEVTYETLELEHKPEALEIEKVLALRHKNGEGQALVHYKDTDAVEDRWIDQDETPSTLIEEHMDRTFYQNNYDEYE